MAESDQPRHGPQAQADQLFDFGDRQDGGRQDQDVDPPAVAPHAEDVTDMTNIHQGAQVDVKASSGQSDTLEVGDVAQEAKAEWHNGADDEGSGGARPAAAHRPSTSVEVV